MCTPGRTQSDSLHLIIRTNRPVLAGTQVSVPLIVFLSAVDLREREVQLQACRQLHESAHFPWSPLYFPCFHNQALFSSSLGVNLGPPEGLTYMDSATDKFELQDDLEIASSAKFATGLLC